MTKVLIIDDDPSIGRMLRHQLETLNYTATYLPNAIQALQQLATEQPDVILLDVMMPQLNGWELCRQIRASSNVPIIMVTGKDAESDVVVGLESGADDYLTKPVSLPQLHARIGAVLRRAHLVTTAGLPKPAPTAAAPASPAMAALPATTARAASSEPRSLPAQSSATAPAPSPAASSPPLPAARAGQLIRDARVRRGASLYQAERESRIRWDFIQAFEQENWAYLPQTQLRPVLIAYLTYLGLRPDAVFVPSAAGGGARSAAARPAVARLSLAAVIAIILVVMLLLAIVYALVTLAR